MPASVRYRITSYPAPQSNGLISEGRVIATGKLTSQSNSQLSQIIAVPPSPEGKYMVLNVYTVYTDPVGKTGGNAAFLIVSEPNTDPVLTATEGAVDTAPRLALRSASGSMPGDPDMNYAVRPGQRFAIQDTGWAV